MLAPPAPDLTRLLRLPVVDRHSSLPGRLPALVFNTGLNFVSQVVFAASLLVASILTSHALGRSDRGLLALLILIPVIIHIILDLGFEQGLTVKLANGSLSNPERRSILYGLVGHGLLTVAVASAVTGVASLAQSSSLAVLGGRNAPLTVAACSLAVLQGDLTGLLYGHQRVAFVSVCRMAGAVTVAIGSAILYGCGRRSVTEYFAVYVAGMAGVTFLMGLRLRMLLPRAGIQAVNPVDWRLISRIGMPYFGASLTYSSSLASIPCSLASLVLRPSLASTAMRSTSRRSSGISRRHLGRSAPRLQIELVHQRLSPDDRRHETPRSIRW